MALPIDPKFIVSREVATVLVPDLVRYAESKLSEAMGLWEKINAVEVKAKRGQDVIVAVRDHQDPAKNLYVRAKISTVNHNDIRAIDGPIIRVKAGNLSWRVDGCDNFLPVE